MDGGNDSFISRGDTINGFIARPQGEGPYPAVIVIHDVWGLSDHYRAIASRLAAEGFVAWAPDLYSREGAPGDFADVEAIMDWMACLPDTRVLADVQAVAGHLAGNADVRSEAIGLTGFCMGGQYTLMAACAVEGLAAAVTWYGMLAGAPPSETSPESPLEMAGRLSVPWLGLFGEQDPFIPTAEVEQLRTILESGGKDFEIVTYGDAGHAFFNDTRPEMYRPKAAAEAWQRMAVFFRQHLGD